MFHEHGEHITCSACGRQFPLAGHLCPNCQAYHPQKTAFCRECGEALNRLCRHCFTANWAGGEFCSQCGKALDIIEALHWHTNQAARERFQQLMEEAPRYKQTEAEASEKRMADFLAQEAARQKELYRRRKEQQAHDRRLMMIAIGIVALFLVVILILSLLSL